MFVLYWIKNNCEKRLASAASELDSLISEVNKLPNDREQTVTATIIIDAPTPDDFVEKNYKEIFYGKSKDWNYEREWRIIKKCADASKEEYLDIESAIIAVILCNGDATDKSQTAFSTPVYESIKGLIGNQYPIFAYESFGGKSLLKSKDGCQIWPTCPFSTGKYELDV